jgi:L-ascorbate metabolism protein UlaG (beta-lactamase superfamily)
MLFESGKQRIYYTGDTRYIPHKLIGIEDCPDFLLIPISNRGLVMGTDDAMYYASQLYSRVTVPLHYDSPKDCDRMDTKLFQEALTRLSLQRKILSHGEEPNL